MNVGWEHASGSDERWTDRAFPAGRALLDPSQVGPALTGVRPPGPVAATARLLDVYYYPGRALQAVHRLADGAVVTVEAVPAGTDRDCLDGELAVPPLGAVARTFPLDPGLPSLPAVLRSAGPDPDLLTYLPGRRCVLGTVDRVAKLSTAAAVTQAHARQLALWSAPDRRFRMAQPLALDADRAARSARRLDADRIELRLPGLSGTALARLVAGELAALHSLSAGGLDLAPSGPEHLLRRLEHKTLRTLGRALPAVAPQVADAVGRLRAAGPPACGPARPVHGDCHLANLLVDDDGVQLLDLDEMALGDAELDLAQFATRALLVALHRGSGLASAVELATVLPELYGQARGRAVDPAGYAWYVAACLLSRQVKTSVRHLAPDLERLVLRLVALADGVLRRGAVDERLLGQASAA